MKLSFRDLDEISSLATTTILVTEYLATPPERLAVFIWAMDDLVGWQVVVRRYSSSYTLVAGGYVKAASVPTLVRVIHKNFRLARRHLEQIQ